MTRSDRGQLVLLAAAALVVALLPVLTAYLQLGYGADVETSPIDSDGLADTERVLERAVHDAAVGVPASFDWRDRTDAVDRVRSELADPVRTVNRSRLRSGVTGSVTTDAARAADWAARHCPGGPDRAFGRCEAIGGFVVQDRAGRTHLLAVAFDVALTGDGSRQRHTRVVEVWPE